MNKFNNKIKEIAKWLSEQVTSIYKELTNTYQNITLERFFEILLKITVVFIIISILRIPFFIFGFIGHDMFTYMDFPGIVWYGFGRISVTIIYIVLSITTILVVFKDDLFTKGKTIKKSKVNEKKIDQELISTENSILTFIKMVIKIFIFIAIIIPLIAGMFSLIIAIALIIHLIIKGVSLYGILILLIGLFLLLSFLAKTTLAITSGKKVRLWSLIVSIIFILAGAISTFDWLLGLDIKQNQADKILVKTIYVDRYKYRSYDYIDQHFIDNSIPSDKVKIKIHYDSDYDGLLFFSSYGIRRVHINDATKLKKLTDYLINNLKDDKLYIPYFKTEVYANKFVINEIR